MCKTNIQTEGSKPICNEVYNHFKMGGFQEVKNLIERKDRLNKVDLKEAYHLIQMTDVTEKRTVILAGIRSKTFKKNNLTNQCAIETHTSLT